MSVFQKIAQGRTADAATNQIETLILEGVLRIGERLPSERDLSEHLGISRPILRDSIKSMEERGILITKPGGGTFVADIIGEVFSPQVTQLVGKHPKAALDFLDYRREIDGLSAEWAASRATEDDRHILTDMMQQMVVCHQSDNFDEEAKLDVAFHNFVGECAHNIVLLHTQRACYKLMTDGVFFNRELIYQQPNASARLLAQHQAIYSAIMQRDPKMARDAAEKHIDYIGEATREAERAETWQQVSALRRKRQTR